MRNAFFFLWLLSCVFSRLVFVRAQEVKFDGFFVDPEMNHQGRIIVQKDRISGIKCESGETTKVNTNQIKSFIPRNQK